jgi:hypothetical protein
MGHLPDLFVNRRQTFHDFVLLFNIASRKIAWVLIAMIFLVAPGLPVEASVKHPSVIRAKAVFKAPEGWSEYEELILGEPVLTLSHGSYIIGIHLLGGLDSRYETPADFLSSWEAKDDQGRQARQLGSVQVGGNMAILYFRTFSLSGKDRDMEDKVFPERTFREEFIIVPTGNSFFVLTFTIPINPPPLPDKSVETAWKTFFKGFRAK